MNLPIWFDFQNKMATVTASARSRDERVNVSAQHAAGGSRSDVAA